ncbi:MAG: ABC transporter ATP-binding protein, partial [Pseudoflavonifractor sp.]
QLFGLASHVMTIFSEGLTGGAILVMLFFVDPALTIFACVLILTTMLLVNRLVSPAISKAGAQAWSRNTAMMKWVNQAMGGLKGVLASRRQQSFINHYAENAKGFAELDSKNVMLGAFPKVTVETVSMAGIFLFMALMVTQQRDLERMLPLFATFALAAVRIIPVANRINEAMNGIRYNKVALDALYTTLSESNIDTNAPLDLIRRERSLTKAEPLTCGIRVENLSFRFSDATEDLYSGVTIEIPARKSVAFVGTTGSGKTTMADIILGLHAPSAGTVTADGHDIHREPDWWADRIGYIPQFIYLCDDTIRANVAFGFAEADISDERVWRCLADAQMKTFVEGLPNGLDTITGENGVRLSGGQRQRIGIARALYTDPPFLVMDEATSALDNDTEQAIIESINALAGEKTLLIIAHRLTTIQNCDIIYRIESGAVTVERGGELLRNL